MLQTAVAFSSHDGRYWLSTIFAEQHSIDQRRHILPIISRTIEEWDLVFTQCHGSFTAAELFDHVLKYRDAPEYRRSTVLVDMNAARDDRINFQDLMQFLWKVARKSPQSDAPELEHAASGLAQALPSNDIDDEAAGRIEAEKTTQTNARRPTVYVASSTPSVIGIVRQMESVCQAIPIFDLRTFDSTTDALAAIGLGQHALEDVIDAAENSNMVVVSDIQ